MNHPGIAPTLLASQVEATAPWILGAPLAPSALVRDAAAIEARWSADPKGGRYFELLLAAHFLTVATFVPTDVDARIRHHAWVEADKERLARQLDAVEAASGWDPRAVSARTVDDPASPTARPISGHDGEWLSVWAGALGRALLLEDDATAERARASIEASLERQARVFADVERRKDAPFELLRAATILAHNAGDLSRVVEQWPPRPHLAAARERLARLGHERGERFGGAFLRAGALNKAFTAVENHRFLALRAPRSLRRGRELLLPIGPFFDGWGRTIATSPLLEKEDRAEIVAALVETHLRGEGQLGCLRALSAIHQHAPGGLDRVAPDVPARMRKVLAAGAVRDAAKTTRDVFEARLTAKVRSTLASLRA